MIALVPDLRRPFVTPPDRNPLPFTPRPSPGGGGDFEGFDVLGTAHFTRRSVAAAMGEASSGRYSSLSIEPDRKRFDELNAASLNVPGRVRAFAEGEFVAATDAFGNRDGDIWLIDVGLGEIRSRVAPNITASELRAWNEVSSRLAPYETAGVRFWEAGHEEEAMRYLDQTTIAMERFSPTLYRALIEERNVIMAARLLEIAGVTKGRGLVLLGKAHVPGIRRLLAEPDRISEGLERYGLNYSSPVRVRRARVN